MYRGTGGPGTFEMVTLATWPILSATFALPTSAVAASISQAKADADQKLKMAEQAVQIAENRAQAEASPILELGKILSGMHAEGGKAALDSYLRNASLPLREKAAQTILKL